MLSKSSGRASASGQGTTVFLVDDDGERSPETTGATGGDIAEGDIVEGGVAEGWSFIPLSIEVVIKVVIGPGALTGGGEENV